MSPVGTSVVLFLQFHYGESYFHNFDAKQRQIRRKLASYSFPCRLGLDDMPMTTQSFSSRHHARSATPLHLTSSTTVATAEDSSRMSRTPSYSHRGAHLDLPGMYREVLGGDEACTAAGGGAVNILHYIESRAPDEQRRAYEVIARFKRDSLDHL